MQSSYYVDVLRGRCQEIPDVRSKVVRVFLSSTFSDTLAERDSLIENVFPKLKDYCREKYGLEFQYADMRWGIPSESSDNHSEVQTCLHEIDLCKKYSVATNFVVLLSHRYGSRPTPATIHAPLFEQLYAVICSNNNEKDNADLLSQWYQLDTNSIPPVYVLKSISSMLPNIRSSDTVEMKEANREWKKINQQIHQCLQRAAAELLKQQKIHQNEYDDFFISVTEKEIIKGILNATDANQRTLCFLREIENIHENISDRKASKFIDLISSTDGQMIVDLEAEKLLNRLKYQLIPNALQRENIFSYKVQWKPSGINRHDDNEYISQFNNDVFRSIQQQIDHCVQSNVMIISDPLIREILEHAIQCKTYISKFHGRIDVIDKLREFINLTDVNQPCIVYGSSGCGKTSVLAKTSREILKWWPNRSVSIILRFLGTTPASSTIYKTLLSISQQICKLYNLNLEIYPDAQQLRHQLETNLFTQIPSNEYLVIILDSLDQLETDAYDCQWLPRHFPHNVKCILSTLPDHGHIFLNLQSLFLTSNNAHLVVFVPPFQAETVQIVFDDWLKMKQRSLSAEQRQFINELMEKNQQILPLYMKLIFDIISTWHSYDPLDNEFKNLLNVDKCIVYLFNRLRIIHSNILFSRAIIYMTACRNGISQNELEDVLSLDDDVLHSVFQHFIPPVRRLPGILWTRIRNDLDEYITEKEADDSTVIYWYHRRFIEVANSHFISKLTSAERTAIFQNMVDFYKETWKGKNKPFKVNDPNLVNKYNLNQTNGEIGGNRLITSQPLEFVDISGQIQFNKRKLNELPQFLNQLSSSIAIPIVAEEVIFNYRFMYAKIRCSPFHDIFTDLGKFQQNSSYQLPQDLQGIQREIKIYGAIYLLIGNHLQEYPNNYAFEITSRLLYLFGVKPHITSLMKQCDEFAMHQCAFVVPYGQLQPPGGALIFSMHLHTTSVVDVDFSDDGHTSISLSDRIIVTDLSTVKIGANVNLPKLNEPYLNSTTIPKVTQDDNRNSSCDDGDSRFNQYLFLVNSLHHIYLVNTKGNVKFERTSEIGFLAVELLSVNRGLCVIAEMNENSIECWNIVENRLFDRIQFPSSTIKAIQCIPKYNMILTKLQDGSIHCHLVKDWSEKSFIFRGHIKANKHLDLIIPIDNILLCTFDETSQIRFAFIGLNSFYEAEKVLSDNEIIQTLISFDPPLPSKPIERIVLPDIISIKKYDGQLEFPTFIAVIHDSLYVVHQCKNQNISYIPINGKYDVICIHKADSHYIYVSRGSTIELYKWTCELDENMSDNPNCYHRCQLYVSIQTSSAAVTTIVSLPDAKNILCSMQNGLMQVYEMRQARAALKSVPTLPRANGSISTFQLLRSTAITIDSSKRELTSWTYQHSTSIDSQRIYHDSIRIDAFHLIPCYSNPQSIFVLIVTSNHYLEIYSGKSLHEKALFSFNLGSPAKINSTTNDIFYILTKKGTIYEFSQKQFHQIKNVQLKIQCTMLLSSLINNNGREYLVIFADDKQSVAIWTSKTAIYCDLNPTLTQLISVDGYFNLDSILLYFCDKSLCLCRVQVNESTNTGSTQIDQICYADKFSYKHHCLATLNTTKNQLDIYSNFVHQLKVSLDNKCECFCLNESSTHLCVVIQPRILLLYRISDGQQIGKLFLYDFVSFMDADDQYVALVMTDRRLLTLMITDPNDPTVKTKIQALPSRNSARRGKSAGTNFGQHLDRYADMLSSSDEEEEEVDEETSPTRLENNAPVSFIRFVTRFPNQYSSLQVNKDPQMIFKMLQSFTSDSPNTDLNHLIDDPEVDPITTLEQQTNSTDNNNNNDLKDIHQKIVQHEQQQIRGIRLANAGSGNIKVVNSYSVTSTTCTLQ